MRRLPIVSSIVVLLVVAGFVCAPAFAQTKPTPVPGNKPTVVAAPPTAVPPKPTVVPPSATPIKPTVATRPTVAKPTVKSTPAGTPPPTKSSAPPTEPPGPTKPIPPSSTGTPIVAPTKSAPSPVIDGSAGQTREVAGRVFDDRNDDGLCGPGESGVAGVLVFVDGRMAASTDEDGRFRFAPVGGGDRIELVFVVSDEWKPLKDPVEIAVPADVAVPLRRAAETRASIKPKSVATTAAGGVLGVAALAVLVFVGFALLTQTAATRSLERAYRQHKSLELEHLQAQTVARRRAELEKSLEEQADDWREIVHQVLADALPSAATDEWVTVTDISASPPHFTAARQEGSEEYVFTVAPELVRRGRLTQRNRVIPLDASLAPTARVEVQAVWQHLMNQHGLERRALPRQAAWYLVVARRRK